MVLRQHPSVLLALVAALLVGLLPRGAFGIPRAMRGQQRRALIEASADPKAAAANATNGTKAEAEKPAEKAGANGTSDAQKSAEKAKEPAKAKPAEAKPMVGANSSKHFRKNPRHPFDQPYPDVQSSKHFDADFIKDDNTDGGVWKTQMKYDILRKKVRLQKPKVATAKEVEAKEHQDVVDAKKAEQEAAAAHAKAKAAANVTAHKLREATDTVVKLAGHPDAVAGIKTSGATDKENVKKEGNASSTNGTAKEKKEEPAAPAVKVGGEVGNQIKKVGTHTDDLEKNKDRLVASMKKLKTLMNKTKDGAENRNASDEALKEGEYNGTHGTAIQRLTAHVAIAKAALEKAKHEHETSLARQKKLKAELEATARKMPGPMKGEDSESEHPHSGMSGYTWSLLVILILLALVAFRQVSM